MGDSSQLDAFERERPRLHRLAYNMLGSARDADDLLQDAWLRWAEVEASSVRSPAAYLTRLVTRLAIDELRSAERRRMEYVGPWLPEPLVAPAAEAPDVDALSTAFLLMLERLSPEERAVLLLRETFGYRHAEVADLVGVSEAASRQLEHRARRRIGDARRARPADRAEHERLLGAFLGAVREGDVDGLLRLLAPGAVSLSDGGGKVIAARRPVEGAEQVARFLAGLWRQRPDGTELRPAWVNGAPGAVTLVGGTLRNVLSLDVVDGRVTRIYIVVNPDKLRLSHSDRPSSSER